LKTKKKIKINKVPGDKIEKKYNKKTLQNKRNDN
jgi:hypothetical protein